jgi:hypothetical protein
MAKDQGDFNFLKGLDGFEGYAVVPVVAYSVTDRFSTFMGAGVEHGKESGENKFLARLGDEYSIFLDENQRFMLLPGGFIDFVDGDSFVSSANRRVNYEYNSRVSKPRYFDGARIEHRQT